MVFYGAKVRDFCFCLIDMRDDDEPWVVGVVLKNDVTLMDDR